MKIDRIRIGGFKSVADMTLEQLDPYSVFAGANGAGKSNLMDALAFVGAVVATGPAAAIKKFGGFSQMHCYKLDEEKAKTFEFDIDVTLDGKKYAYALKVHDMDRAPFLEESLVLDGRILIQRAKDKQFTLIDKANLKSVELLRFPDNMALMMFFQDLPIYQFLTNIRIFRFEPLGAKEPDASSTDASELDTRGHNVATMLAAMEKDDQARTQITEWMELLVPGMQKVLTEQQRLDGGTAISFIENGTSKVFPARLISDGTIYALCIMVAVLSRAKGTGITLIEEPERGIHPQAITELVQLMRDNATPEHPVFVTTHSESLVRASTKEELWLVDKAAGKTIVKNAAQNSADLGDLNLDTAWLMNMFGAGLPW
jgi:predicted ATPase